MQTRTAAGRLPLELLIYLCPLSYDNLQACPIAHTVTGANLLCYQRPGITKIPPNQISKHAKAICHMSRPDPVTSWLIRLLQRPRWNSGELVLKDLVTKRIIL
jgi:hypothetical protein